MIAKKVHCPVCNHVYALFPYEYVHCICGNRFKRGEKDETIKSK